MNRENKEKNETKQENESFRVKDEDIDKETEKGVLVSSKRNLSMEDPDYVRPPDAKRMRQLEEKAQDELCSRVVRVVDRELTQAMNEKESEIEEIDNRILRLQQCLHTLRYCVSLNFYAAPKVTGNIGNKDVHIHPCVRKHIGKAPIHSSTVTSKNNFSQILSNVQNSDNLVSFPSTSSEDPNSNDLLGTSDIFNETRTTNDSVSSCSSEKSKNDTLLEVLKNTEENKSKVESVSCPPSPKYLPPKAPESSQKIVQGRHQKFQQKKRVVVGNTYQYIGGVATGELSDQLRYKWQMYVRGPTKDDDVSSFVASVKFILDQSYAPHDVITIKKSPFVLSRRGWGEFKVQIVLEFINKRNKSVRLLHPLVLSRPDDQLALTGLWRLGQENWYDVWVYEASPADGGDFESSLSSDLIKAEDDEEKPSDLQNELRIGSVISKCDDNVTVIHNTENEKERTIKSQVNDNDMKSEIGTSEENSTATLSINSEVSNITSKLKSNSESVKVIENRINQNMNLTSLTNNSSSVSTDINASNMLDEGNNSDNSSKTKASVVKESNGSGGKVCKIHVRQPDGRLLPCYIPSHMYSLALKIAQGGNKATPTNKDNKVEKVNLTEGEPSSSNSTPTCSPTKLVISDEKKLDSIKETGKPISLEPSTTSPPNNNDSRLTLTTQGGQTVARLATTSLSASMVQQLLNKATGKNKASGVVQKVANVSGLQIGQGKIINNSVRPSLKTNIQFVPLKLLQDKQTSVISKSNVPVSAANVKLITSNGQLIKSSNQLTRNVAIAPASVTTTTTTFTSTVTTTSIGKVVPSTSSSKCGIQNMVLMPGGCLVSGQVVSGSQIVSGGAQVVGAGGQIVAAGPNNQVINSRRILSGGQQVNQVVPGAQIVTAGNTKGLQIVTSQAAGQILTTGKAGLQLIKGQSGNQFVAASGNKGLQLITSQGGQFVSSGGKSLQLVTGRGGCKLVSAGEKGKGPKGTTVVHLSPLVLQQGDKGNLAKPVVPIAPNKIVNSVGAIQANKPQVAGVSLLRGGSSVPLNSLLKPLSVISTSGIKSAPTLISGKNLKPIKPAGNNLDFVIKNKVANIRNKQLEAKFQDLEDSIEQWELQCRNYEKICGHCTSLSGCLRVWARAFPVVAEANEAPPLSIYPYCAASTKQFLEWPIGKQRAHEYGRAREILKKMKSLKRDHSNFWTLSRIIGWTRKHGYTPVKRREYLSTDGCPSEEDDSSKNDKLDLDNSSTLTVNDSFCDDIDVVAVENDTTNSPLKKILESPNKSTDCEFLSWEDDQLSAGCDWVSQCASELRISLPKQQLDSHYTADISKAMLWKSCLSFMEDLLRSSHCASWDAAEKLSDTDEVCEINVPPVDIDATHVKAALYNARPEFQLFSNDSLTINSDTIKQLKGD